MPNGEDQEQVNYEDFKEFADNNPGSDNADFYKQFPNKPQGTLRRWKMKYNEQPVQKPPEQPKTKTSNETMKANNKVLMRGTMFTDKNFAGMSDLQINRFLVNFHNQKKKKPDTTEEDIISGNTPIIGTPVGSGRAKMYIDEFMKIDPKAKKIEFVVPSSIAFGKFKSRKEAKQSWVQP